MYLTTLLQLTHEDKSENKIVGTKGNKVGAVKKEEVQVQVLF